MSTPFRPLRAEEISVLKEQQCYAENWDLISVKEGFRVEYIYKVRFSGNIVLGIFEKEFTLPGGIKKHSGIRNATLHNCTIGDHVYIENINNYIANYTIEDYCYIENCNLIVVDGKSSFGNGVEVSVLNETGGREVPIYDELSAHLAYIITLYRHRPVLISRLKNLIGEYAESKSSETGIVGHHSKIINTGSVRNVCFGPYSDVEGASRLENGSLNSNAEAPVVIGQNVVAENFIFASGAHISDGAVIARCFVGQACHISHLFSAHDSLFFSNCQSENGEACAIFAGPYTVSMHKSSLLIAGMFSFLNAGSGSNQSNHMYKLGPIHQGIVERGSKTTSDSYVLWPAKIGAFSLVMGRHVNHPDTSELPFSYLIEQGGASYLVPGINLKSVGTIRDVQKWPKRDKRTDKKLLDQINFNLLSPYTIQKMLTAVDILHNLQKLSGMTSDTYSFHSTLIKNSSLRKGLKLYSMAICKFLGNSLIKKLEHTKFKNHEEIREQLKASTTLGEGEWIDLSGLIAPKSEIEKLLNEIENNSDIDLKRINDSFVHLHQLYYEMEWTWTYRILENWFDISIENVTAQQIIFIVDQWKEAVIGLDMMLYEDAKKEFSLISKTGFGADGNGLEKLVDFEQVRGAFESNPFVQTVKEHISQKRDLGDELIGRLKGITQDRFSDLDSSR